MWIKLIFINKNIKKLKFWTENVETNRNSAAQESLMQQIVMLEKWPTEQHLQGQRIKK